MWSNRYPQPQDSAFIGFEYYNCHWKLDLLQEDPLYPGCISLGPCFGSTRGYESL